MSDWFFGDYATAPTSPDYLQISDSMANANAWDDDITDVSGIDIVGGTSDPGSGGSAGGGSGEITTLDAEIDDEAPESPPPCTEAPDGPTPAGVDIDELRRKARDMANGAADKDKDAEWGGLIWADASGNLHTTRLATIGSDETAAFALGDVAPGGRIVATFHTHPDRGDGVNQGVLNPDDRKIVKDLQAAINDRGLNVTIDPKAMMYVTDNKTGETKEFDVNDPRNSSGVTLGPCGSA